MLRINTDLSIEITRGDAAEFVVTVKDNGENYVFKIGDIVRFKVFEKKGCDCVVLQKDFGVESDTEEVTIVLEEADTKIGGLINKPKDYWYEVELNPDTLACTIIGYDEAGAKVFKLYPEGRDLEADPITPEDIPFVDRELDLTSHNPVENQAIAREFDKVNETIEKNADTTVEELSKKLSLSGGTMTGILSMGGKKLTGLADPENDADAVHLGYANRKYAPKSHTEDKQNPHNVTAAQVGARPNTWMPTASDVGARPNTWMPTFTEIGAVPTSRTVNGKALSSDISLSASDVGARPSSWMPSAADVGARPNNWTPTAGDVGAAAASHRHSAGDINSGTLPVSRGGTGVTTEAAIGLKAYPVNSIYMSVGSTSPASLFGGTWTRLKDRFLLGAGDTYANGKTGGAATVTLTENQIPSHSHLTMYQSPTAGAVGDRYDNIPMVLPGAVTTNTMMHYSGSTGGGGSHNNMPPYLVVYMWKRTA